MLIRMISVISTSWATHRYLLTADRLNRLTEGYTLTTTSIRKIALVVALAVISIGVAYPIVSADASATTTLVELNRVNIPGTGDVRGAATSPDNNYVYVGRGNSVSMIDTSTETVVSSHTLSVPIPAAFILDLDVSSDGSKVFVITHVSTASTQIDVLNIAGGLSFNASFTHGVGGNRVNVPANDPDHFVVTGQYGWIQVRQDTLAIITDVAMAERVKQGTVSDDGTRVYGQKQNSVASDTAYGFTMAGAPLGSFTFGDAGGGMFYTTVNASTNDDRVLLFAGDSALGQNAYVLNRDANHIQTLGITGISEAAEGVDGETVILTQNQGTSSSQNSGLSLIN